LKLASAYDFTNGLAKVYFYDDDYEYQWGYIDKKGKTVWETSGYYDEDW
jgi:hypothetical protein